MRKNRIIRNRKIQSEYKELYQEGFRHQKCCEKVAARWCLEPETVAKIVAMDLPELPKTNQIALFNEDEDNTK